MKLIVVAVGLLSVIGCSTATYRVVDPKVPEPKTHSPKTLQSVEASAPGGETYIAVVYFGKDKTPLLRQMVTAPN
jgi:hypothetical protein